MRGINKSKLQQNDTEYRLVAYVKDSENCPGHVSLSLIKKSAEKSAINHTSFYPGPFGCMINALSFGSIPVFGRLAKNHLEDFEEADHVLVKNISREQYRRARAAQKEFANGVRSGDRVYSVFGTLNPVASWMGSVFTAHKSAQLTEQSHRTTEGFYPPEDICGIAVYANERHVNAKPVITDNCTSSATHILNRAGIRFSNPLVPTLFAQNLPEHGFEKVEKKEIELGFKYIP